MATIIKWIVAALGTVLACLITSYTLEYFRPYKKK
jgi:hypothetical protein